MSCFEPTTASHYIKPLRTAKRHKYAPACKQYVGGNPATETNQPKDRRHQGEAIKPIAHEPAYRRYEIVMENDLIEGEARLLLGG